MSYFDGKLNISVASASGIEAVTKNELVGLGYAPGGANNGRITFSGSFLDVARCNMFLRTAGRVRINIAEFSATTFDELFEGNSNVRWEEILPQDAKIIVTAKSYKSALFSMSAIQSITKKAIVERMKKKFSINVLEESGATYSFEVSIVNDIATISLDTSGVGLHKRGYRTMVGEAPLRETTAAAMLLLSFWKWDKPLIDPFTGSGTIPIEAALIATNSAPGLNRHFAFEEFPNAPKLTAKDEAQQLIISDRKLRISGFDIDPKAIKLANLHAENAGVKDLIHFQTADMRTVSSRFSYGVIVSNPPYGERLMKGAELFELYKDFGKMFSSLDDWSAFVITSCLSFEKHFGKRADKWRTLYNSELECRFYSFYGNPPRRDTKQQIVDNQINSSPINENSNSAKYSNDNLSSENSSNDTSNSDILSNETLRGGNCLR
ncbi:MAG TPA: class I SAM-dependent RNA methyltransferase [Clostridia bacterium]|nr:class I SAM-dependent RNA methyltransferase [Clostridia bacterium]